MVLSRPSFFLNRNLFCIRIDNTTLAMSQLQPADPERARAPSDEKDRFREAPPAETSAEDLSQAGWSSWFGGQDVAIGPRIGPVLSSISLPDSDSDQSSSAILDKQLAAEDGHAIQYRTCSWQKTAGLLFSEYICLVSSRGPAIPPTAC